MTSHSGKWQPNPVFLPREFHGQRSLLGYIQSMGSQSIRHDWTTNTHTLWAPFSYIESQLSHNDELLGHSRVLAAKGIWLILASSEWYLNFWAVILKGKRRDHPFPLSCRLDDSFLTHLGVECWAQQRYSTDRPLSLCHHQTYWFWIFHTREKKVSCLSHWIFGSLF